MQQTRGEVVYHDLIEFAAPETWPAMAQRLVAYYQSANEGTYASVAAAPALPKGKRQMVPKQSAQKKAAGSKRSKA